MIHFPTVHAAITVAETLEMQYQFSLASVIIDYGAGEGNKLFFSGTYSEGCQVLGPAHQHEELIQYLYQASNYQRALPVSTVVLDVHAVITRQLAGLFSTGAETCVLNISDSQKGGFWLDREILYRAAQSR